jgi:hypothetical protein
MLSESECVVATTVWKFGGLEVRWFGSSVALSTLAYTHI